MCRSSTRAAPRAIDRESEVSERNASGELSGRLTFTALCGIGWSCGARLAAPSTTTAASGYALFHINLRHRYEVRLRIDVARSHAPLGAYRVGHAFHFHTDMH